MTGADLELVGERRSHVRGMDSLSVSMLKMPDEHVQAIRSMLDRWLHILALQGAEGARWMDPLIADVDRWLHILEDGISGDELPRTLRQYGDYLNHALAEYIRTSPGQRIYRQDPETGTWEAFYASSVDYHHEQRQTRHYGGSTTLRPGLRSACSTGSWAPATTTGSPFTTRTSTGAPSPGVRTVRCDQRSTHTADRVFRCAAMSVSATLTYQPERLRRGQLGRAWRPCKPAGCKRLGSRSVH